MNGTSEVEDLQELQKDGTIVHSRLDEHVHVICIKGGLIVETVSREPREKANLGGRGA